MGARSNHHSLCLQFLFLGSDWYITGCFISTHSKHICVWKNWFFFLRNRAQSTPLEIGSDVWCVMCHWMFAFLLLFWFCNRFGTTASSFKMVQTKGSLDDGTSFQRTSCIASLFPISNDSNNNQHMNAKI